MERGKKARRQATAEAEGMWAIRVMLDQARKVRDRALFDLAIDSKLRGCDLVKLRIGDLVADGRVRSRAMVVQQRRKGRCSLSC